MVLIRKSKNGKMLMLVIIVAAIFAMNQWQLMAIGSLIGDSSSASKGTKLTAKLSGNFVQDAIKAVIPTGTPEYGAELSVTFDDPVESLDVIAALDRQIPTSSLTQDELARYINIDSKISCEFCCGAISVIDSNGRDACGCAHAAGIRGLTKYLVKNHPAEWTDDQILLELTKWKVLFFPKNMVEKAAAALENGLELTPAVLNDRDLLKKIKSGSTADIGELPAMVGGC